MVNDRPPHSVIRYFTECRHTNQASAWHIQRRSEKSRARMFGMVPATKSNNSATAQVARSVGPRVSCQMRTTCAQIARSVAKNHANSFHPFRLLISLIHLWRYRSKISLSANRNAIHHYQITRERKWTQKCNALKEISHTLRNSA